jgi:chromate transporter
MSAPTAADPAAGRPGALAVFAVFLRLGLTIFGGPTAHIAVFRRVFVERLRWLDAQSFAELFALCQALPGPTSSQLGMAIGYQRAGLPGTLAAWTGFTLPAALILAGAGLWAAQLPSGAWQQGLHLGVCAVVIHAVVGLWTAWCGTPVLRCVALLGAAAVLVLPPLWGQLAVVAAAAVGGRWLSATTTGLAEAGRLRTPARGLAWAAGLAAVILLVLACLPVGSEPLTACVAACVRAGSLVFGGGHVVLPLLEPGVVAVAGMDRELFLAGYGLAQVVPGPLFAFAAFCGAERGGALGALIATGAIFLPGALLVLATLPLWSRLRGIQAWRGSAAAVNAVAVGLLLAAAWHPLGSSAVHGVRDAALVLVALAALLRLPAWVVVPGCALAASLL